MARKKRRKSSVLPMPKIKQDPDAVKKKTCPHSMIRYDNTSLGYSSIWICRICMVSIISEKGVKEHLLKCNLKLFRREIEPEIEFNPKYECDVCKKIFKRLVILEKHKLDHFKPKEEEEEEEYYEEVPRKKRRRSKKMQVDKKISKRLVTMQKPKLDHVKPKEEEFYEEVPCKKRGRSKKIQDDKKVSPLKIKLEIKKEKFY